MLERPERLSRPWNIIRGLSCALCLFVMLILLPGRAGAHYDPMIEESTPVPPSLAEPGEDAALVQVTVLDRTTGERVSATVSVNGGTCEPLVNGYRRYGLRYCANRQKGPIRFRPLKYYFYTAGSFEVRVPPGTVTLEFGKGYEYAPRTVKLELEPGDTASLEVRLERWIDSSALGWYSGDTHIHMERTGSNDDSLLALTSAKDIRYAYLLSMNTQGYAQGGEYEGWLQAKGLGDRSAAHRGPYFISSGQEYRTSRLGHVTIILPDSYVPGTGATKDTDLGPSLALIADQTHELNGYIGLAHGGYFHQEADGLLLAGKLDFLELLQFGGYRSLGLEGWYDFLNIGYRLPIVGACDFPYTRELGSEITYVWSDSQPSPRTWARAAAEGKSFASSGPLLFLKVAGKKPGEIIAFGETADTTLPVELEVRSANYPVRYLELIVNGWVVKRELFLQSKSEYSLQTTIRVNESQWVAARTWAEAGTEAHTNPVYLYVGGKLPFNRDSARNILARLEGSLETIDQKEVLQRLSGLKGELEACLAGRKSRLPLPSIP